MNSWNSEAGGIQTVNREFALALAAIRKDIHCVCLTTHASNAEVEHAANHDVTLIGGSRGDDWSAAVIAPALLAIPPGSVAAIVGHGNYSGDVALDVRDSIFPEAMYVHVVHTTPFTSEHWKEYREDYVQEREARSAKELSLARRADLVVCIGPRIYVDIADSFLGHDKKPNLMAVTCGFLDDATQTEPPARPTILFVGRTDSIKVKGLDILARSVARLGAEWSTHPITRQKRKPRLIVRGARTNPKEVEGKLKDLARDIDPHVEIIVRPYTSARETLRADFFGASVFVLPSRDEPYGLVACEAISYGVPTVMSSESGIAEVVQGIRRDRGLDLDLWVLDMQRSDEIVEQRLADAMLTMLMDPEHSRKTAQDLRQICLRDSSWDTAAQKIVAALATLEAISPSGAGEMVSTSSPAKESTDAVDNSLAATLFPSVPPEVHPPQDTMTSAANLQYWVDPSLSIDVLYLAARASLGAVARRIARETFPSRWSPEGSGWHELFPGVQRAGFYASCEGLRLLLRVNRDLAPDLIDRVYHNHLVRVLRGNPSTDEDPTLKQQLKQQRDEAWAATLKLAEFIMTSATVGPPDWDLDLVHDVIDELLKRRCADGSWRLSADETSGGSILATVEVVRALASLSEATQDFNVVTDTAAGAAFLSRELDRIAAKDDVREKRLAPIICLGLSEVLSQLPPETTRNLRSAAELMLAAHDGSRGLREKVRYPLPSGYDDYHFNIPAVTATTLLKLMKRQMISPRRLASIVPALRDPIDSFLRNDLYVSPGDRQTFFWEMAQQADTLLAFVDLCSPSRALRAVEYMYVSPTLSTHRRFAANEDLCALLVGRARESDVLRRLSRLLRPHGISVVPIDFFGGGIEAIGEAWKLINQASFVIADCPGRTAAAFYGLGIAHTLGKRALVCEEISVGSSCDFPGVDHVHYDPNDQASMRNLRSKVRGFADGAKTIG